MDLVYFFSVSSFFMGIAGTMLYFYDADILKKGTHDAGFWVVGKYGSLLNWIDSIELPQIKDDDYFIVYKGGEQKIVKIAPIFDELNLVIHRTTIENNACYKIINEYTTSNDIQQIDKPFLQFELVFGDKKFEIQNELKAFYVNGNTF